MFLLVKNDICFKFATHFVPWCNGNTPVFGTVIQGSSPCGTTCKSRFFLESGFFYGIISNVKKHFHKENAFDKLAFAKA